MEYFIILINVLQAQSCGFRDQRNKKYYVLFYFMHFIYLLLFNNTFIYLLIFLFPKEKE